MTVGRKKKDFKLRQDLALQFERYAPAGKQTAIVEALIESWLDEQKRLEQETLIRKAYERANEP